MKFAVFALIAAALLLLGCAASQPGTGEQGQQPAAGAQNPQEKTTPPQQKELTGTGTQPESQPVETQVPPAQKKLYTCALTLSPETIQAGQSTDIGFSVSTKDNVVFTYNCGDEVREISTGGLTGGSRLCQFNTAGTVQVWIKADGEVCAQKLLTVRPNVPSNANCSVNLTGRNAESDYYEMRVDFTGFAPEENITWTCDYTTINRMIGGTAVVGMPLYEIISCDYSEKPRKDFIEVFVGGLKCGQVSTR